jgi:hypothetical protein
MATNENPPSGQDGGLRKLSSDQQDPRTIAHNRPGKQELSDAETADISIAAAEARVDLLLDDIGENAGAMIVSLNVLLAMRDTRDAMGMIYSARRARAYWMAIAGSARDLVAAEAQRLSILRQNATEDAR